MKVVVGLGNPGKKYQATRHNIGFMVVEELAKRHGVQKEQSRFDAIVAESKIGEEKVLLVKPLTYMNLSGNAVQPLLRWYKLENEALLVIYDDMDLPTGEVRIRQQGGHGGHKGIMSIIDRLATQNINRIRIGIGRDEYQDTVSWVLGKLSTDEAMLMQAAVQKTADAVECWIKKGINITMNTYN